MPLFNSAPLLQDDKVVPVTSLYRAAPPLEYDEVDFRPAPTNRRLGRINGVDVYENHNYRVTYNGPNIPRVDGAIWRFLCAGRGGTVHGAIVSHPTPSVAAKYRNYDLYLSPNSNVTITPVSA